MGTGRIKIIEIILYTICGLFLLYCFFCTLLIFNDILLYFNLKKYILAIFYSIKDKDFFKILFSFMLSSLFSGFLFFYGLRRERKKDEKNQRLVWYTELVLNNLQKKIQEYFNLTEDFLNDSYLNKENHRLERNKLKKELECLLIFDMELYEEIIKILSNSIDNFSAEKNIDEKIKENTRLKVEMLKKLLNHTRNI